MSTRLTKNNFILLESQSLTLISNFSNLTRIISDVLSKKLLDLGFTGATPSTLNFLSTLECGINYASDIARATNVSRQMVAKSVKELCQLGYLIQKQGIGKQKTIEFTSLGEALMAESRRILAEIDEIFNEAIGDESLKTMNNNLQDLAECLSKTKID